MHTLFDVETQIPTFFHITEVSVHDTKAMKEIPYEPDSYYTELAIALRCCARSIRLELTSF